MSLEYDVGGARYISMIHSFLKTMILKSVNPVLQIREFKGKTYVDIREFYVDKSSMETKPGKKGICLNTIQFQQLRSIISEVNAALP